MENHNKKYVLMPHRHMSTYLDTQTHARTYTIKVGYCLDLVMQFLDREPIRFGRPGVECYCQHESGAAVIQLQFLINEVGYAKHKKWVKQ